MYKKLHLETRAKHARSSELPINHQTKSSALMYFQTQPSLLNHWNLTPHSKTLCNSLLSENSSYPSYQSWDSLFRGISGGFRRTFCRRGRDRWSLRDRGDQRSWVVFLVGGFWECEAGWVLESVSIVFLHWSDGRTYRWKKKSRWSLREWFRCLQQSGCWLLLVSCLIMQLCLGKFTFLRFSFERTRSRITDIELLENVDETLQWKLVAPIIIGVLRKFHLRNRSDRCLLRGGYEREFDVLSLIGKGVRSEVPLYTPTSGNISIVQRTTLRSSRLLSIQ